MNRKIIVAAAAFALAVATTAAGAHGDSHAAGKAFDATQVEETAFGRAGDPHKVSRTIRVALSDAMRFTPANLVVKRGETVRFVVHNGGKVLHEMVLGTAEELREHAELMRKFPEMEHSDANMAHVPPGQSGEIVWQFTKAGAFSFACLVPGHFEAGMVGKVLVK